MATLGKIAAVLAAVLITVVVTAPAAWLAEMLSHHGALRLVHAEGSLWQGSALLAVSDGRRATLLPGRISWDVDWRALFAGRVAPRLSHAAFDAPVELVFDGRTLGVAPGAARLPAALLAALGAPFNSARPGGLLRLRWEKLLFRDAGFEGAVQLDWEDAQSALSPIAPLGNFRVAVLGKGARAELRVTTLKGPLQIMGEGSMENGTIRFSGTAEAEPEMRAALAGLIGLMGRRSGDRAVFNWESRK